ncbi:MAG: hypothetical protein ABWJ97_02940 [Thermoproteus sp.]
MAKKREGRSKRRGRIFIIAVLAIIFAEVGYILGTSGIHLGFSRPPQLQLRQLVQNSQLWVLTERGYAPSASPPPLYNNSIVVITVAGLPLPKAVLNSDVPVYVLMLDPIYGPYSFSAANYFYNVAFNGNYTIASRYQNKVFLIMPGQQQSQATEVFTWVLDAISLGNVTITASGTQLLTQILNYLPVEVKVANGKVVSAVTNAG